MSETDDAAQPDVTPLDFLRAVYCNEGVPLPVRMRAAIESAPYVHPRLQVTASLDGRDFAGQMEEIARRTGRSNVIDAKANHVPAADRPTPQLTDAGTMPPTRPSFRRRI